MFYSLTDPPTSQCLFAQVATHAPLMVAVPGKTDSGLRSSQLVEFVDIFPTIVEADFDHLSGTVQLVSYLHRGFKSDASDRGS